MTDAELRQQYRREDERRRENLQQDLAQNIARTQTLRSDVARLIHQGNMPAVFAALGLPWPPPNQSAELSPLVANAMDHLREALPKDQYEQARKKLDQIKQAYPSGETGGESQVTSKRARAEYETLLAEGDQLLAEADKQILRQRITIIVNDSLSTVDDKVQQLMDLWEGE